MKTASRGLLLSLCVIAVAATGVAEDVISTTVCQIKQDPAAYNHRLVEVSGFVSHDFEDFLLFDPTCNRWGIWLEYGGKTKSDTVYCCGDTAGHKRSKELVVEEIPVPLVINDKFSEFDKSIQPPFRSGQHGAVIHATLIGRFFAGQQVQWGKGKMEWGGYGHMGCCTLLAIQEVKSVDTDQRSDLDYGASPDQPDIRKTGCGFQILLPFDNAAALIDAQREADAGKREWAFDHPQRVASETFASVLHLSPDVLSHMMRSRESQGREVYEIKGNSMNEGWMVVVSRPYWLSFYAKDRHRVAWVAIAGYESSCGK